MSLLDELPPLCTEAIVSHIVRSCMEDDGNHHDVRYVAQCAAHLIRVCKEGGEEEEEEEGGGVRGVGVFASAARALWEKSVDPGCVTAAREAKESRLRLERHAAARTPPSSLDADRSSVRELRAACRAIGGSKGGGKRSRAALWQTLCDAYAERSRRAERILALASPDWGSRSRWACPVGRLVRGLVQAILKSPAELVSSTDAVRVHGVPREAMRLGSIRPHGSAHTFLLTDVLRLAIAYGGSEEGCPEARVAAMEREERRARVREQRTAAVLRDAGLLTLTDEEKRAHGATLEAYREGRSTHARMAAAVATIVQRRARRAMLEIALRDEGDATADLLSDETDMAQRRFVESGTGDPVVIARNAVMNRFFQTKTFFFAALQACMRDLLMRCGGRRIGHAEFAIARTLIYAEARVAALHDWVLENCGGKCIGALTHPDLPPFLRRLLSSAQDVASVRDSLAFDI